MKIGIYGGTFDPVHLGHLNLATEIMEAHHLDLVWFCPAAKNPFKPDQASTSAFHRLNMLKLAIEHEPRFFISEVELEREGVSYTIDTLKELHHQYPEHQFFLILGEDAARSFHKWNQPEAIISLAQPLIGCRGIQASEQEPFQGSPNVAKALKKGLTPTRVMEISATEIRKRLLEKKSCYHLIPGKVMDYIITNRLY